MQIDLDREDITELLHHWNHGDVIARNTLFEKVYEKMRAAADAVQPEHGATTLVSLVHDAFLRLSEYEAKPFRDRTHFAAVCVRTMRNLLVDRYRRLHVRILHARQLQEDVSQELPDVGLRRFDVRQALVELAQEREDAADAITLKIWGGLDNEEIADVTSCSPSSVRRRPAFAKFFLQTRLKEFQSKGTRDVS